MVESDRVRKLRTRVRILLVGFMIGLTLSGVTAFPLPQEIDLLYRWMSSSGAGAGWLFDWISTVHRGALATDAAYPFLFMEPTG